MTERFRPISKVLKEPGAGQFITIPDVNTVELPKDLGKNLPSPKRTSRT